MLDEIKVFLGIEEEDYIQDRLLNLIIIESRERILSTLNQYAIKNGAKKFADIPDDLSYIHRDVAIKRFNRINSEGTSSDSEEGRSYTWEKSYLSEYFDLFDEYTKQNITKRKSIARFI
ncbi:hypothetical protein IGI96_000909 [Enterococcus sp. DIV0421]|uniref:phage head-tail connector protein n=1 Tax=Enterococcus sp. DIV0421 TaxID=2774688 RepID=UPI003F25A7F2